MDMPVQVTFQGLPPSDAVRAAIDEHLARVERYHRLQRCRVVIAAPHQHSRHGNLYSVRLEVTMPGAEQFVNRDRHDVQAHEDVYVALRDAFGALERQLERRNARRTRRDAMGRRRPAPALAF